MSSLHIPYAPVARHRRVSMALPLVIASYPGWTTASAQTPEIVVAGEVGSLASGQISRFKLVANVADCFGLPPLVIPRNTRTSPSLLSILPDTRLTVVHRRRVFAVPCD